MVYDRIRALELHRRARGKVKVFPTININDEEGVFLAAYPGSVAPGEAIVEDKDRVFEFTGKGNRLAVITDGSAICGMGNVGPLAGMPMIEGKCLLFKLFGDVNAIPLCVESGDPEELIHMVTMIAPNFGGINLEDISSPNTFTMLRKLELLLDTPVFCDDQDGTAMLVPKGNPNGVATLDDLAGQTVACEPIRRTPAPARSARCRAPTASTPR